MYKSRNQAYNDHRRSPRLPRRQFAKRIGILKDESEACEGAVIEEMSDEELKDFCEDISICQGIPEHKIRIIAGMAGERKYRSHDWGRGK